LGQRSTRAGDRGTSSHATAWRRGEQRVVWRVPGTSSCQGNSFGVGSCFQQQQQQCSCTCPQPCVVGVISNSCISGSQTLGSACQWLRAAATHHVRGGSPNAGGNVGEFPEPFRSRHFFSFVITAETQSLRPSFHQIKIPIVLTGGPRGMLRRLIYAVRSWCSVIPMQEAKSWSPMQLLFLPRCPFWS
jgi:hypothetical protein